MISIFELDKLKIDPIYSDESGNIHLGEEKIIDKINSMPCMSFIVTEEEKEYVRSIIENNYMKDYFLEAIIPDDVEGIRPDIAELINNDIKNYRDYMIRQYNGNVERATDEFCFKKFLNEYSTAINVFGLHKEYDCKGSFNRHISYCWNMVNGHEEDNT